MTVTPFAEEHDALRDSVARLVADLAPLAEQAEATCSPPPEVLDRCREMGLFGLGDVLAEVAAAEALGRLRSAGLVRVLLDQMLAADVGMDVSEPVAVARLERDGTLLPLVSAATVARPCLALGIGVTVDLTGAEVRAADVGALRGAGLGDVTPIDAAAVDAIAITGQHRARDQLRRAAAAVGAGWQAFDDALAYAGQREAFGRPIGRFQVNRHALATIATRLTAAAALLHDTAWRHSHDPSVTAGLAADHAAATTATVTDMCLQLYGGYGYTAAFDIQRAWRDAHVTLKGSA